MHFYRSQRKKFRTHEALQARFVRHKGPAKNTPTEDTVQEDGAKAEVLRLKVVAH